MDCEIEDERSEEQQKTHTKAVVAKDRALSGWGSAKGGISMIAWALAPELAEDAEAISELIAERSDMYDVEVMDLGDLTLGAGVAHLAIWPMGADHPYARQLRTNQQKAFAE